MKQKIIWSLILCLLPLLFNECTNGDDIGDLYGRWKLDSFSCSETTSHPDTIFIGFQGDAYSYQPNWEYYWGVYEKTDTTLFLSELQYGGRFTAMFLDSEYAYFTIVSQTEKELVLMRNDSVWVFRKYLN